MKGDYIQINSPLDDIGIGKAQALCLVEDGALDLHGGRGGQEGSNGGNGSNGKAHLEIGDVMVF